MGYRTEEVAVHGETPPEYTIPYYSLVEILNFDTGRSIAQPVSRRLPTAAARVGAQVR
jgi:hypothetical protein